jgi:hypothetical protein
MEAGAPCDGYRPPSAHGRKHPHPPCEAATIHPESSRARRNRVSCGQIRVRALDAMVFRPRTASTSSILSPDQAPSTDLTRASVSVSKAPRASVPLAVHPWAHWGPTALTLPVACLTIGYKVTLRSHVEVNDHEKAYWWIDSPDSPSMYTTAPTLAHCRRLALGVL